VRVRSKGPPTSRSGTRGDGVVRACYNSNVSSPDNRVSETVSSEDSRRRSLLLAAAAVPILVAAVIWLPSWWERREFWQAQEIAGVGARIAPGTLTEARKKVDPGIPAGKIEAALGKPSISSAADGKDARREIWTYFFADGKLTINLTDGVAQRIGVVYGKPRIPHSYER
jgi:hypothetical protein